MARELKQARASIRIIIMVEARASQYNNNNGSRIEAGSSLYKNNNYGRGSSLTI